MFRRSVLLLPLAAATAAACDDGPAVAAVAPRAPGPVDSLPPHMGLRLVVESDSTARIEGIISDDGEVSLAIWGAERPGPVLDEQDTLRFAPTRQLPVRVQLPRRPWGRYRVGMAAADRGGHYAFWNTVWVVGPRAIRIDSLELLPPGDTLRQPGLEFTPTVSGPAGIRAMHVFVDTGTAAVRRFDVPPASFAGFPAPYQQPRRVGVRVPPTLANGPRTLTLLVVDSAGAAAETTFRYVVHVPEVPYRVRFLGTLGGGDSRVLDLSEAGDAVGDAPNAAGVPRGWLWRVGDGPAALRELPTPEPGPSSAVALNGVGDVVGTARVAGTTTGVAWRVAGDRVGAPEPLTPDGGRMDAVVDVNDARLVLGFSGVLGPLLYQLGSGFVTRIPAGSIPIALNAHAQVIAPAREVVFPDHIAGWGDGLRIVLPPPRPGVGGPFGNRSRVQPVGIDDAGEVLGVLEGEPFLSQTTTARYLTQFLPGTPRAISRRGEVLAMAGRDSVFIWNRATGTRRVAVADRDWTIDAVTRLNDRGVVAGHGTNARTGERGAVLLVPAGAPPAPARRAP